MRKQFLYVTCDFEGSLDVYKLPPSGVVPVIWSKDLIINAHKSSRNYNQRILLLNNLLYRGVITSGEEYSLRIFSNFLLNDDVVAANYYLDKLILTADEQLKNDWKSVGLYLKARALTKQQLSRENSREYKTKITELIKEIQNKNSATSKLVQAILYSYIERYVQSLKLIKSISDLELSGVNHILYSLVLNGLESKKIINADNVFRYYKPLLNSDKIPQESQLFYAFVYLSKLQTLKDKKSRIILLEKQMATFKNKIQLAQIFKAEWSSLKIIVEQDKKSKSKYYQVLDKIMSETRSEYFLRKSIYVRVLENFIEADEVQYLTYVATTWLKYTDKSDTEFAYARDIYIDKVFARAYMNFSDKNYNYAANNFFGAVGFTDDLESHFGYIKSSFFNNKGQDLNKTYESMYQRKVINESIHYVNSILELSQFLSEINNKSINIERKKVEQVKLFEDVLKKLKDASTFFQTPVYQLLLGFSYLKLTELSIDRYEFSQEMSSLAHKHLMLAYDLGRYNKRVRASALSNLSFLHLHISNWGMAKRFFEMREKLGFVDNDQMFSHYWFYAKASYYLSDYEVAISSIQRLLKNVKNFKDRDAVLLQKLAFYQLSNGDYKSAEINFLAYLNIAGKDDLWNIAKSELGLGYAQFKMFTDKKTRNNLLKTRALNSFKKSAR